MVTVKHFFQYLTQHEFSVCAEFSPFFIIISALCPFGFGELGRQHQKGVIDESIAFKERLQEDTG